MHWIPLLAALALIGPAEEKSPETLEELPRAEVDAFLQTWHREQSGEGSLVIEFRQEKKLRFFKKPLVSRGKIRMAGGRLLCEVLDAKGQLENALLVDGGELKIFYPRLERLEIFEVGKGQSTGSALPIFGSKPEVLHRDYHVKLERFVVEQNEEKSGEKPGGEDREKRRLSLKARSADSVIREVILTFEGHRVKEVIQKDRKGSVVRMILEKIHRDEKLTRDDLELEIPGGTKRVRIRTGRGSADSD